jgi:hypothetical protein
MSFNVRGAGAAITGATANGVLTVADTTLFYEDAVAWVSAAGQTSRKAIIVRILTATTMSVRFATYAIYGANASYPYEAGEQLGGNTYPDATAYAAGRIDMPEQFVRTYAHTGVPV